MSHVAGIDITVSSSVHSTVALVDVFLNSGWSINDDKHISYLPLGDEDEFNWQDDTLESWPKVVEILQEKEKARELIGLVMTWKDTDIGGEFLFFPGMKRLSVGWNVNRRTLQHCAGFTDHSWYLSRILAPLLQACVVIESIQCYDTV